LDLIRASAAGNLRDFVLNKGGLPRLLWGESAQWVGFKIDTGPLSCAYPFRLVPVPQSASFRIAFEMLEFQEGTTPAPQLFVRHEDELMVLEGDKDLVTYPAKDLSETETALSMVTALWGHPTPYQFQQQLRAWAIYQGLRVDEDAAIRRSAVARREGCPT
jgi:predicted ATPase